MAGQTQCRPVSIFKTWIELELILGQRNTNLANGQLVLTKKTAGVRDFPRLASVACWPGCLVLARTLVFAVSPLVQQNKRFSGADREARCTSAKGYRQHSALCSAKPPVLQLHVTLRH